MFGRASYGTLSANRSTLRARPCPPERKSWPTPAPAYILANLVVEDADRYREYEKRFFPVLKKHGGSFITFDDATVTLEGDGPPGRLVIFTFPSETAAQEWYADPEYQEISEHRRAGTTTHFITLVHSLPPR